MKRKQDYLNVNRLKLNMLDRCIMFGVSALIIIIMVAFRLYTHNAQANQIALMQLVMEKSATNQKTQFENYINDKIKILQMLATYPDIYEMDEMRQMDFIKGHTDELGFQQILVVNTDGIWDYIQEDIYRNQSKEEFYDHIMNSDVAVSEPYYAEDGNAFITGSVWIYNDKNEKVGLLCGVINLDSIQALIENNEMILGGECFIIDESGNYITSSKTNQREYQDSIFGEANSQVDLIKEVFAEKSSKSGQMILNNVEYEVYLNYLPKYNWIIVQSIPVAENVAKYETMKNLQHMLTVSAVMLALCIKRIIYCWKKSDDKIYTDTLTKCNSRAACISVMEKLEPKRDCDITIMYMDLNKFKYVNDTLGHEKGDELLRIFGSVLKEHLDKRAFVGRMGGDEFIAIFIDTSEAAIFDMWREIERELVERSKLLDFAYTITASYGCVTRYAGDDQPLSLIIQMADKNMYANKEANKLAR